MKHKLYIFRSTWNLPAPKQQVWQTLTTTPFSWTDWWPQLTDVRNMKLTKNLSDTSFSCTWRSPTGYRLNSDVTIGKLAGSDLVTLHSEGDLRGTVRCRLTGNGVHTRVEIAWHVETTRPWMNRLAFLLRPVFVWSHHRVMRSGERGLRSYLSVQVRLPQQETVALEIPSR